MGKRFSEETYQNYLNYTMSMYGLTGGTNMTSAMADMLQTQTIEGLIYMEEVKQACEAEGCLPTEEEENEYLYTALGVTDAATYSQALMSVESYYGLDKDTFETIVLSDLYADKLATKLAEDQGLTVADEEAQTTYEEDPESYNTRTVSHILIMPTVAEGREAEVDEAGQTIYTEEEWAAAKTQAEDIVDQLNDGADFAELAKEYSADGSAQNGGALGEAFAKNGSPYVEEFTAASFDLTAVGEYTKAPVKTQYGYHIILCTGIQDADNDYEGIISGIKENLLAQLKQTAVTSYIEEFDANSEIVINVGSDAAEAE